MLAYTDKLNLYDVVLAEYAYSDLHMRKLWSIIGVKLALKPLNNKLKKAAAKLNVLHLGVIHSSDIFTSRWKYS